MEVLQDVPAGQQVAARAGGAGENAAHHFQHKSAGAGGKIERGHDAGFGEPAAQIEITPQQVIDRAHDELDHRRRGVINAAPLALFGVVGGEKIFIKIKIGVVALGQALAAVSV